MKNILLCMAAFFMAFAVFAEDPPLTGWEFNDFAVVLNGRRFFKEQVAESWREQDGYAIVNGESLHYWLYDTVAYHSGKADDIYNRYIPYWVEKMGYVIDYDNVNVYDPNTGLASSVQALMKQRGCDISIAFIKQNGYDAVGTIGFDYVVINEWFKSRGVYKTTIYPLHMREVNSWITKQEGFPTADGLVDLGAMSETEARKRIKANYSEDQGWNVSRFRNTFHTRPQRGHLYMVWCPYFGRNNPNLFIGFFWVRNDDTCLVWIIRMA